MSKCNCIMYYMKCEEFLLVTDIDGFWSKLLHSLHFILCV